LQVALPIDSIANRLFTALPIDSSRPVHTSTFCVGASTRTAQRSMQHRMEGDESMSVGYLQRSQSGNSQVACQGLQKRRHVLMSRRQLHHWLRAGGLGDHHVRACHPLSGHDEDEDEDEKGNEDRMTGSRSAQRTGPRSATGSQAVAIGECTGHVSSDIAEIPLLIRGHVSSDIAYLTSLALGVCSGWRRLVVAHQAVRKRCVAHSRRSCTRALVAWEQWTCIQLHYRNDKQPQNEQQVVGRQQEHCTSCHRISSHAISSHVISRHLTKLASHLALLKQRKQLHHVLAAWCFRVTSRKHLSCAVHVPHTRQPILERQPAQHPVVHTRISMLAPSTVLVFMCVCVQCVFMCMCAYACVCVYVYIYI